MRRSVCRTFYLLSLTTGLAAQIPQLSYTLPQVVTATTLVAGSLDVQTATVLPCTVTSSQMIGGEFASATVDANVYTSAFVCAYQLDHELTMVHPGLQPAFAESSFEVVLELTAPTPMLAELRASAPFAATAGAQVPQVEIDVFDDGVFEYQSGDPFLQGLFVQLTTVPTRVRVRASAVLFTTGTAHSQVSIEARPYGPTWIQDAAMGCSASGNITVQPTFPNGIDVGAWHPGPPQLFVLVFGTNVQPAVLPASAATPCLLLPSLDVLVPTITGTSLDLPLPAALRPFVFWTQGVVLAPEGLLTTTAFRVDAP